MLSTLIKAQPHGFKFLLIVFVLLTSGALILARWKGPDTASGQATTSDQTLDARLEVELITLRPYGFEPREITRPKGPFILFVEDRSGRSDSSLRLQEKRDALLRDVNTTRVKSEWHDTINLPAGEYTLIDGSNPESRCQITILP